jgi:hypothetical protein
VPLSGGISEESSYRHSDCDRCSPLHDIIPKGSPFHPRDFQNIYFSNVAIFQKSNKIQNSEETKGLATGRLFLMNIYIYADYAVHMRCICGADLYGADLFMFRQQFLR